MVSAVLEAQGVMNDKIKKATLMSALQDHALTWYIEHSNDHLDVGIEEIQNVLNIEFSWPKTKTIHHRV